MPITQLPPGGFGEAISPQEWAKYVLTHLYFQSVVLQSGATRIDTILPAGSCASGQNRRLGRLVRRARNDQRR
jgi:hypothetical protein